jgi:hypothetical protein
LTQGLIRGEALGTVAGRRKTGAHCWREGDGCAGGDIGRQSGRETSSSGPGQPATNRLAVDAQQAGHLVAVLGLPGGPQGAHLSPGLLVSVICMVPSLLKRGFICMHQRPGMAPW